MPKRGHPYQHLPVTLLWRNIEPLELYCSGPQQEPDRNPQTHLPGYSSVLQADAYGGYLALYESGRITEAMCMAHAV